MSTNVRFRFYDAIRNFDDLFMIKFVLKFLRNLRNRFRSNLCFVVFQALIVASITNAAFAEQKQIVDEINTFLTIQKDAYSAISSGIGSLERSCFSNLPQTSLPESLSILKQNIAKEKNNSSDELSFLQSSITRIDVNSKALATENCSVFDFLIDNSQSASACGKSQTLKKTTKIVLEQILEQKQVSEKMYEAFDRLLQLETKECATEGFSLNIFNSFHELIEKSVGKQNEFYKTRLEFLKTQVQEIQKND